MMAEAVWKSRSRLGEDHPCTIMNVFTMIRRHQKQHVIGYDGLRSDLGKMKIVLGEDAPSTTLCVNLVARFRGRNE